MFTVLQTEEFVAWLDGLKDKRGQVRIAARLRQAEAGNLGDWQPVGGDVSEMRVDFGPGYRLYFTRRGRILVVLLNGGNKSTQKRDIRRAHKLASEIGDPMTKAKSKATPKLVAFDAARYLDNDKAIAEYMTAVLETGDADLLLLALADVARAKGMAKVAQDSGLGRESLYKALAPGAKPRFETIVKVAKAHGVKFTTQSA